VIGGRKRKGVEDETVLRCFAYTHTRPLTHTQTQHEPKGEAMRRSLESRGGRKGSADARIDDLDMSL